MTDACAVRVDPPGLWKQLVQWVRCCPLWSPLGLDRHEWEPGEAAGGYREGVVFRCRQCGVRIVRRPPVEPAPPPRTVSTPASGSELRRYEDGIVLRPW